MQPTAYGDIAFNYEILIPKVPRATIRAEDRGLLRGIRLILCRACAYSFQRFRLHLFLAAAICSSGLTVITA